MIIVVFSRKSTGKTTFACSLAADLNNRWESVCLIDADPQCSASRWCARRKEEFEEEDEIPLFVARGEIKLNILEAQERYKYVIVDCAGRDSVELRSSLLVADLALMMSIPSYMDREHYGYMAGVVEKFKEYNPKLKVRSILSLVTPDDKEEVKLALKDLTDNNLAPLKKKLSLCMWRINASWPKAMLPANQTTKPSHHE